MGYVPLFHLLIFCLFYFVFLSFSIRLFLIVDGIPRGERSIEGEGEKEGEYRGRERGVIVFLCFFICSSLFSPSHLPPPLNSLFLLLFVIYFPLQYDEVEDVSACGIAALT